MNLSKKTELPTKNKNEPPMKQKNEPPQHEINKVAVIISVVGIAALITIATR